MDDLWTLIEDEAEAVKLYYQFLETDFAKSAHAEPVVATVLGIIAEELDHIDALRYLFDQMSKAKPETSIADKARETLKDFRERAKLIK